MPRPLGYTRGDILMGALGSFWNVIFRDKELVKEYVHGIEETLAQAYFNLLEMVLCKSVHDIPVFHREKWTLLVFKESEINKNTESLLRYGVGGFVYGAQPQSSDLPGFTFTYGGFAPGPFVTFALPGEMVDLESYICNKIHEPSVLMTKGLDFFIKNKVIFFKTNPFENDLIAKRNIIDKDGNMIDREIALWALNSDHDHQFLYRNYGYVIDMFFESSENYKDFLRSVWSLFLRGPRFGTLISTLNAMFGLPIIKEPTETIQLIEVENSIRKIVTDKNIYEMLDTVSLSDKAFVGSVLEQFDHLSNAVNIVDNVSVPKWWSNRRFLPIPIELLSSDYFDSLKVFNDPIEVDLQWNTTFKLPVVGDMEESKKTLLENFPLQWGTTGAQWGNSTLSFRGLDFVMEHFYKNNVFLLEIRLNEIEPGRVNSDVIRLLNEALPAYIFFIGLLDIELLEQEFDLESEAVDEIEVGRGQYMEEEYVGGDLTADFTDGHHGYPRWNDCLEWGGGIVPPPGQYNRASFLPCVRVRMKKVSCG